MAVVSEIVAYFMAVDLPKGRIEHGIYRTAIALAIQGMSSSCFQACDVMNLPLWSR